MASSSYKLVRPCNTNGEEANTKEFKISKINNFVFVNESTPRSNEYHRYHFNQQKHNLLWINFGINKNDETRGKIYEWTRSNRLNKNLI